MNYSIKTLPFIRSTKLTNGFACVFASNYCKSIFSSAEHGLLTSRPNHSETQATFTNLNMVNTRAEFDLQGKELISKAIEGNLTLDSDSLSKATVLSSIPTKHNSETDDVSEISNEGELEDRLPPEPPVYCCGTGCPTCSWIVYAEELKNYYNKDIDKAKISLELDKIKDPSVRMFIKMELGL